ncbi:MULTISPECIES: DUF1810 domain-containing protein [unclassified Arthrobacter]|uniref:DUF1810 domain-containing protein n=1 Tax=unclassified Arthrobacter TaxID=235627 RepID=UPI001492AA48|nr:MULTISPECIES: DUF1810 domain-containing protein [unclassified Arthrobacter]MBE0008615.1 DUF1810 domain-containing protein [Arthrobacter sp. AET 35A]NOJ62449.1 DUF1810 domain-containing protein [Arthrobacter sp. 147(2020)]
MTTGELQRFVSAQDSEGIYERAMEELAAGRKESHWMWFVFPQLAGLGRSPTAQRYAVMSIAEARAYLGHPVLGPRLVAAAQRLLSLSGTSAQRIFGSVDAQKLRSSMTLFSRADPEQRVFDQVLERYFDGEPDPLTDRLL